MAKIILGALVSDIGGSIGGTTFRRVRNGHIVYNKQSRQLRSASSVNSRKSILGNIFRAYSLLPETDKQYLSDFAKRYTVHDNFGRLKNLTARQLYIKLQSQLVPVGAFLRDFSLLDSTVIVPSVLRVSLDFNESFLLFDFSEQIRADYLCVSFFEWSASKKIPLNYRRKVNCFAGGFMGDQLLFDFEEFAGNLQLSPFKYYGVQLYALNTSGFKSVVQSFVIKPSSTSGRLVVVK